MSRLSDKLIRWATGRRVLLAVLLFGLGGSALFRLGPYPEVKAAAEGATLPEEAITNPVAFRLFLADLGVGGRESYLRFQMWDLANPLLVGFLSVALIGWLVGLSGLVRGRSFMFLVAFLTPVSDLLENVAIMSAIVTFPNGDLFARTLPVLTTVKFGGLATALLLAIGLAVVAIHGRMRRKYAAT